MARRQLPGIDLERRTHLRYLATTLTNQKCSHEEMRADSIQGMRAAFRSRVLLPKNINIAVRATVILLLVYG